MKIKDIFKNLEISSIYYNKYIGDINEIDINIELNGLSLNSKECKKNYIFFATIGKNTNSHNFIKNAVDNGAFVIVYTEDVEFIPNILYIKVNNIHIAINTIVSNFYNHPSKNLNIYAITGTNGKTTTAKIIKHILSNFEKTGYIGTLGIEIGDKKFQDNHLTTPDNIYLNKIIKQMVDENTKSLAIEISSHSLEQHRCDNLDIDVAIFSNLTHEHLDFHENMENYKNAKLKLFKNIKKSSISIINIDDKYAYDFINASNSSKIITFGKKENSNFQIKNIKIFKDNSTFTLIDNLKNKNYEIFTNLVSEVNVYNLCSAIIAINNLGYDIEKIINYTKNIDLKIGRFQLIKNDFFNIIIDFAHTPDSFEKVYQFAKTITKDNNKIFTIFGSAGQRDTLKRPLLGEISDKYCDKIILTEDDYRDENPLNIANEILEGIKNKEKVNIILDRFLAIEYAIKNANKNDTILILSKALDRYIPIDNSEKYWMGDDVACKEILKKLKKV